MRPTAAIMMAHWSDEILGLEKAAFDRERRTKKEREREGERGKGGRGREGERGREREGEREGDINWTSVQVHVQCMCT